jgi:hypothetical protein
MTQNAWIKEMDEIQKLKDIYVFENQTLLKEIEALIGAQDEVVTLLYSRRSLEVLITEICEEKLCRERGTEPLNSLIDKLYKEKFLPEYIQTSMQNLNRISTFGAHPKEFDPRQVRTALIDLVTVLEWYIKEKGYKSKENVSAAEVQEKIKSTKTEEPEKPKQIVELKNDEHRKITKNEVKVETKPKPDRNTKKFPLASVVIASLVIIIAVTLFFILKPKSSFNADTEIKTLDTVKPSVGNKIAQTKKSDTTNKKTDIKAKLNTELKLANSNEVVIEKPATSAVSSMKKTNEPVVKETRKTYSIQEPQTPKKENIYNLFQQLGDVNKSFAERKSVSQKLILLFDSRAFVTININNQVVDRMAANDYINRMLTLKGLDVKILNQSVTPAGKIKSLDVVEIRK